MTVQAMKKLTADIQTLIELHDDPFVLIAADYRIVAANQAYCDTYGVRREQVIGLPCHHVSHHSATPCHQRGEDCPHRQVLNTQRPHQVLHTHLDALNRPEQVRIKGIPIKASNGALYVGERISSLARASDLDCEDMRMVGRSPALLDCMDKLSRVAEAEAPILLYGESGVGKELAAHYIHQHSLRRNEPFLAINCAAIPDTLFENELFGHEKGAFTGCLGRKAGLFELANGGSLFLDEIGEIPLPMQAKLLRVLETGEFRRVGGGNPMRTDVRIISATNRDLLNMTEQDLFRQDLYYRIAGIDITLPPLRERRADIPALAELFLKRLSAGSGKIYHLADDAITQLTGHDFPGNVRELRNMLHKAAALSGNGVITARHLALDAFSARRPAPATASAAPPSFAAGGSIMEQEARYIAELLARHQGHRRKVADMLGISERTLYRKLNRYQLRYPAKS